MCIYVCWSKKSTGNPCCCPRATSCPTVRVRHRDGAIVGSSHALLPSLCHSAEAVWGWVLLWRRGHSVSMSRSWCLERSITIYMLIFDSSLLPDAHTLVQRCKTLVLWVLSRTERNLRMEELTSRSHSRVLTGCLFSVSATFLCPSIYSVYEVHMNCLGNISTFQIPFFTETFNLKWWKSIIHKYI